MICLISRLLYRSRRKARRGSNGVRLESPQEQMTVESQPGLASLPSLSAAYGGMEMSPGSTITAGTPTRSLSRWPDDLSRSVTSPTISPATFNGLESSPTAVGTGLRHITPLPANMLSEKGSPLQRQESAVIRLREGGEPQQLDSPPESSFGVLPPDYSQVRLRCPRGRWRLATSKS